MAAGERELIDRARDVIAARITAEHPGWLAGHDLYGWHAHRLEDGHVVRATGPDGLRALIGAQPPFVTCRLAGELRRAHPGWHLWRDGTGWWHARRRGNFRQEYRPGAPLYALHEPSLLLLRDRLQQQDGDGTAGNGAPGDGSAGTNSAGDSRAGNGGAGNGGAEG
jgi:hypothetical protein